MQTTSPHATLLTAAEVAERLGVGERHVWRLGREGRLPRVRLSRRCVRFLAADVDAYIAARREVAPPARRARLAQPVSEIPAAL